MDVSDGDSALWFRLYGLSDYLTSKNFCQSNATRSALHASLSSQAMIIGTAPAFGNDLQNILFEFKVNNK